MSSEKRDIAIILGGQRLGAVALAGLVAAGITPVYVDDREEVIRDRQLLDDLNRAPGLLEISALDLFRPRRHDERRAFGNPIHQRLFNPVAAPVAFTITEPKLTKRQRRRLRGKTAGATA